MLDTEMSGVINNTVDLAQKLGYPVNPPCKEPKPVEGITGDLKAELQSFWSQYLEFVASVDGFSIDGFSIFGLASHGDELNGLAEYNAELSGTESAEEGNRGFIWIGTSGTDWYVYNIPANSWEIRDRIAIDEVYDSFTNFRDLLMSILNRIKEANDLA
ncbi:hypothetical protein V462_10400 [Pantoea ananatis 15320]|uniref:YrhA family protein n=1 Tax=Pantoea ananas TaxID=553 RepID=UPI0004661A0E|nr:YrhA family protein [Pantoea ananatis]PKC36261.1 hypothetical protein V462_10400 [Pantoea ananatis 15320]